MTTRPMLFGIILAASAYGLLVNTSIHAQVPEEREPVEAIRPNPNIEFLKIRPNDTSDELWARAVWLSLPPNDAESEEIAGLFIAAIDRAKHKAPIYVSFGQTDSGPGHFKKMLADTTAAIQERVTEEIASGLEKENLPDLQRQIEAGDPAAEKRLTELVQQAYAKGTQSQKFKQEIEAIAKTMTEGTSAAERYYLAAIAEDPAYLPARYFLAKETEGRLHEEAVASFIRHDPDNALGYYLQAAIEIEKEDLPAALKQVEKGNKAKFYRLYESPLPRKFSLKYPLRDDLQKVGVAGEPMPVVALHTLVRATEERWSWSDRTPGKIRHIALTFAEEAKRHSDVGAIDKALPWLLASRGIGRRLRHTESTNWPSVSTIIMGIHIEYGTYEELKPLYELRDERRQLATIEAEHERVQAFREELSKALDAKRPADDAVAIGIFRGQYDPFAKALEQINHARRKAGFLK